jgi:hypothetical protein
MKSLVECLRDAARTAGVEADEDKIQGSETDEGLSFCMHHFVADLKAHPALALDFAQNPEFIVRAGGLFVLEAGGNEDGAGIPSLEIGKNKSALKHVIVARTLAILEVNRVVHMTKGIDVATAHPQF